MPAKIESWATLDYTFFPYLHDQENFSFIGTITAGWYFAPLVLLPWAGIAFVLMKVGQDRLEKMDI